MRAPLARSNSIPAWPPAGIFTDCHSADLRSDRQPRLASLPNSVALRTVLSRAVRVACTSAAPSLFLGRSRILHPCRPLLSGSLIPTSAPSNAHPPLVMAYLALAWKILGFTPVVTRTSMLLVAAFALLGVFRLAQRVANTDVAVAAAICTALYPVFFTQSSLAHLDLAAAGLTFWGLLAYVDGRRLTAALWFSLAVLAKETAILAPLALFAWESITTVTTALR